MSRRSSSDIDLQALLEGGKELPRVPEAARDRVLARALATAAAPLPPAAAEHAPRPTWPRYAMALAMGGVVVGGVVAVLLAFSGHFAGHDPSRSLSAAPSGAHGVSSVAVTGSGLPAAPAAVAARGVDPEALVYRIAGGSVLEGGYLRESGGEGVAVDFSEGSKIALTPGTRGRLREVNRDGARIAIEHGTASFRITPGARARWLVDVGPFLVTVKGTVFTVAWEPSSQKFELTLERGSVAVSGPVSAGEITLRAGQRLSVDLARAETVVTDVTADRPSAEPAPSDSPAQASRKLSAERRWSEEMARGHWDRILADAERVGIETALATASSEDLLALADAARYRRRPELARSALLAERRRFPGSPRALDAIYLLGRVEESGGSGTPKAIAWYDEYLSRAPNGRFSGEALGRKMTLTNELQGSARARPIAEEYLRRFPRGSYAGSARALMGVE